jgi:hypothetical protein
MSMHFQGIRQVGYVVKDIEAAMNYWVKAVGVGPWFYRKVVDTTEFNYYGKPSKFQELSIAVANSGDLQIELIQQHNDAPSLYLDTLAKNGEVAQHIAYWTLDEFDAYCAQLKATGHIEGHSGRMGQRGRFAYFVHPDCPSALVEVSELQGGKAEHFEKVKKAALQFNGEGGVIPL